MWTWILAFVGAFAGAAVDRCFTARRPSLRFPMKFVLGPGVNPDLIHEAVGEMMLHPEWIRVDFERLLWKRGLVIDGEDVVRTAVAKPIDGVSGGGGN